MEKIGEKREFYIVYIIFFIIIGILLISTASAGFFDWLKKITGKATGTVKLNVTVGVPQIITVYNSSINLASGLRTADQSPPYTSIILNFSVYNPSGAGNLNLTSARVNFTKSGEATRQNLTCQLLNSGGNYANFTCNITMWYWDAPLTWDITAAIRDNQSNWDQNTSTTFYVGAQSAFVSSPAALTWPGIGAGSTNQTSNNDPLLLNNTANMNISINNIQINSTNLRGEIDNTKALWAGNFSVAPFNSTATPPAECNSTASTMNRSVYTNVTNALLLRGNNTKNYGNETSGQEQLYFCIRIAGSELTTQAYSTANETDWTIYTPIP